MSRCWPVSSLQKPDTKDSPQSREESESGQGFWGGMNPWAPGGRHERVLQRAGRWGASLPRTPAAPPRPRVRADWTSHARPRLAAPLPAVAPRGSITCPVCLCPQHSAHSWGGGCLGNRSPVGQFKGRWAHTPRGPSLGLSRRCREPRTQRAGSLQLVGSGPGAQKPGGSGCGRLWGNTSAGHLAHGAALPWELQSLERSRCSKDAADAPEATGSRREPGGTRRGPGPRRRAPTQTPAAPQSPGPRAPSLARILGTWT